MYLVRVRARARVGVRFRVGVRVRARVRVRDRLRARVRVSSYSRAYRPRSRGIHSSTGAYLIRVGARARVRVGVKG